jgi:hypothetical protein
MANQKHLNLNNKEINMNSVEEAYRLMANQMMAAVNVEDWERLELRFGIFNTMVSSEFIVFLRESIDETKYVESTEDAALYLRDDLLRTTGARIWGLTFTLYPNGKFNLEYDYNKPEGYEETDDIITGDEMNASLNLLSGKAID